MRAMAIRNRNTQRISVQADEYGKASQLAEGLMERANVTSKAAAEATLVLEALFHEIAEQGLGDSASIDVTGHVRPGEVQIVVGFEGDVFVPPEGSIESPEGKILQGFGDRISYSYRSGYNTIQIAIRRSYRNSFYYGIIGLVLALVAYVPIEFALDAQAQSILLEDYIVPLEQLFGKAMLMIGAPMTFFSLMKNLTETYIVSERESGLGKLQLKTIVTSFIAVALAFAALFTFRLPFSGSSGSSLLHDYANYDVSFAEFADSLLPSNIFDGFGSVSPMPLIIIALLSTYALCTTGKHFDALKSALDACYALCSHILRAVMVGLPFFGFLAFLESFMKYSPMFILYIAEYLALMALGVLFLFGSYAIRLRIGGVKVVPFVKKIVPLVRENFKIDSVLEAVPLNIRYCARNFGLSREKLEKNMPVLAQINLDGNCLLVTLASLTFLFAAGTDVTWEDYAIMALLVVFLSLGAPNQPGSLIISLLIITNYFHMDGMVDVTIFMEVLLGSALNIINVIGDVVMAMDLE